MYRMTDSSNVLIRIEDGASVSRGTWLWPSEWLEHNTPEPMPGPTVDDRINAAWSAADAACLAGADRNSRERYLSWALSGTETQKLKIAAVIAWMDNIWMAYATYRANPVGAFTAPDSPCPYTFWDIAN